MITARRIAKTRTLRRKLIAKRIGSYESLEKRQVMANDFLAGTAFIDTNGNSVLDVNENYLPGATIELRSADGSTLIDTKVTDTKGAYLFTNLTPGDYKLVNRSAPSFVGSSAQPLSQLNTVTGQTANTIDVTLGAQTDLTASVDIDLINDSQYYENVEISIAGNTVQKTIGQLRTVLEGNDLAQSPSNEFLSLSVDLFNSLDTGINAPYSVDADPIPVGSGSPQNGPRIAYLFNHYAQAVQDSVNAAALQLAVWELLYDTQDDFVDDELSNGNFSVTTASFWTTQTALWYLNDSLGKSETATFLNVASQPGAPTSNQTEGIVVSGSFNFANVAAAKIGNLVWHDINVNGRQEVTEPRISGAIVNLYQNATLIATTTTNSSGIYQFDQLSAGTYQVEFLLPTGFTQASPTNTTSDDLDSDGPLTDPIVLTTGQVNNNVDQGFYKLASLGDFVWHDRNGNGFQGPGEEGIPNATVKLFRNNNLINTDETDSTGFYFFRDLEPGVYKVEFIQPTGYLYVSPQGQESSPINSDGPIALNINLESGEIEDKIDQGYYGTATLGNYVWHDEDADGVQDSSESGIDGVIVSLLQGSTVLQTTQTTNGGAYSFNVVPGTYSVRFTQPSGYTEISATDAIDPSGDGLTTVEVTVATEDINNTLDIGFYNRVTIGNYVWHDLNADGIQDSNEEGIAGVDVRLIKDGNVFSTTQTVSGGLYTFNVAPGTYSIEFIQPTDYTQVSPTGATNDDLDSDGLVTESVTVLSGGTNNSLDLGLYKLATIGNYVWYDTNANGIQDSDEQGIDGVTVSLIHGTTITTVETVDGGRYWFHVVPGTYSVQFTQPAGYSRVSPTDSIGDDSLDSDGLTPAAISVLSGDINDTLDQGFFNLAKIGNFVWNDSNADGAQNVGELGVDGVTVNLVQNGNVVDTTETTGGGIYSFSVVPGTYSIEFTKPSGYSRVSPKDNTDDQQDSDGLATDPVTVRSGDTNNSLDLGLYNLATIGDFVWHDLNGNGIQEGNEDGIDDVTVSLIQNGGVVTTTQTAGGGLYSFSVEPGTYTIEFTKPSGYSGASPSNATDDNLDSDGLTTTPVTVVSDEVNNSIDLGLYKVATIGNYVWDDSNADGIQDSNELGINDVIVSLWKDDVQVDSTTTTGGGLYSFIVAPGTYTIRFTRPDGYSNTSPTNATADDQLDSDGPITAPIAVASDAINNSIDQGFFNLATIGSFVWNDSNANGVQDGGELGIDGVTVSLMQGDTVVETKQTTGGGQYSFGAIPGTYYVKFTQPAGYSNVSPANATVDDELDSDGLITAAFTVTSGAINNSIDQGFFNLATIGSFVWNDADADGTQDGGELGIDGVTVSLMQGDTVVETKQTAGGGLYSFSAVPGTYSVKFTQPATYTNVSPANANADDELDSDGLITPTFTVTSGGTNNSLDQGFFNLATIGSFVWNDADADGTQDGGELGIDGVTVSLMQGDTVVETKQTAGGGLYSFSAVPGTYSVKFTQPATYTNVSPANANANDELDSDGLITPTFTVTSGGTNNSLDQGFFNLATIGNFVWNDADADGIQDSTELGIDGVTVALMQGTTEVATKQTAGGGLYSFSVIPGTYSIKFTQPANYNSVSPVNATTDDLDSDGLTTATFTVVSGEENNTVDQGFFNVVSNVCVAIDMQGNSAESGSHGNVRTFSAGGVSVNASAFSRTSAGAWSAAYLGSYGGGLGVTDSSETGASTTHTVDNIGRVNYVLFEFSQQVTVDAAYLGYVVTDSDMTVWIGNASNAFTNHQTLSDAFLHGLGFTETNTTTSTKARTADINAGGIKGNILVIAAQADDTTPEDYFKIANLTVCIPAPVANASIGDAVWHDVNGNGIKESGDLGISGATVTLVGGGPDTLINGVGDTTTTTTTDSSGNYKFANLVSGTQYRVTFSVPSGYDAATVRKAGTNTGLDSDGLTSDIVVLSSNEFNTSIDAGFYKYVKIGNYVWNDVDKDGLQEYGEVGIAGVQLTLVGVTGSGASVTQSTSTASNGSYQFATLQPGTYVVSVAASNFTSGGALVNYTASPTAVGSDRSLDSNAQPTPTSPATLSSGGSDHSLDFGYYASTALACMTLKMEGNTATSGTAGNIRTFSAGGVSVKASAFARDSAGTWSTAYLGSYAGGLGVTDNSEGTGGSNMHMTDNVGRRNYILFEFSQTVTIDSAFLGYISVDSDLTAWIGTVTDPYLSHRNLSDSYLTGLGYSENNDTNLTTSRTADLNPSNRAGNVLVISAATTGTQNDWFKLAELTLCAYVPAGDTSTKFFVVDDNADKTFKYTSTVQYTTNFAAGTTSPTGIAANPAGTNTWVSDSGGRIFKYDNNGVLNSSWSTGIASTQGVSTNGTSIWTVSNSTDRVYFYSGAASFVPSNGQPNPTLTSSFKLHISNTNPKDLATDGTYVWVVDDGWSNLVYTYTTSGTYLGRWQLDSNNYSPSGITIDPTGGSKIWIVDASTDKIYEYNGATGCRSGGLIAAKTYSLNTGAGNSNPQGIADPPGDAEETEISEALAASLLVDGSFINPDINPYYNVLSATDVNDDGLTTAIDALMIINRLNSGEAGKLSIEAVANGERLDYTDTNNDGTVSPLDALLVINAINTGATGPAAQPEDQAQSEQAGDSTDAADAIFGDMGTSAEGEMSAAAFLFDADIAQQRRRRS